MKNYELIYLISSDVSREELKNLSEKIKSFIQEEKGAIKKTREPSKTKLGCRIKAKGEAFLSILNFSFHPEKIANLEKKLKGENQILRYMILNKDLSEKILYPKRTRSELKTKEPEKVELKEIDKKIEEILNQ